MSSRRRGCSARGSVAREYVRVGESRPIPKTVDWANAPSQYKLYRGCPKVPLSDHSLGRFLRDVYGLTRQRWHVPEGPVPTNGDRARWPPPSALRPVPAGGARYPCELYLLAGRDQPLPPGVYHYDPAHHRLDVLRDGAPAAGLSLLVTVAFWKNVFKYGEFSYRLHSLDAGVVLGQSLAVCAGHEFDPTVRFQFSDAALDRLLGLDPAYESVYAVLTLSDAAPVDLVARRRSSYDAGTHLHPASRRCSSLTDDPVCALLAPCEAGAAAPQHSKDLCDGPPEPAGADEPAPSPQPAQPHPQSIGLYPLPAKLHEASMESGGSPWPTGDHLPPVIADAPASVRSVPLPTPPLNVLDGLGRRRSSKGHFSPGPLTREQLGALLSPAMRGYSSDLGDAPAIRHTMLCCAVHDVDGVEPGVYFYDPARHALEQVRAGDVRAELQASITSWMFNLFHVNLCFFPVANYEPRLSVYGDRWYRVQNMEAGIIVQRLFLAAAALGLGCQTQLGFHVDAVNTLLGLGESPLTSLIQVLVAPSHEPGDFYEYNI